jgi:hypothetical protein
VACEDVTIREDVDVSLHVCVWLGDDDSVAESVGVKDWLGVVV